jgi:AcrR family transcriptional regulator
MKNIDLSELNLSEKEEKILRSAIKLFSERGFKASTSKEIAREAGVAEGTIFKYFKTKKDILSAILIHLVNLVSEKIILKGIKNIFDEYHDQDIKVILKKIIHDRIKLFDKIFPMAQVILTEAIINKDLRETFYNKIFKNAYGLFNKFYDEMLSRGIVRNDIEPMIVFRSVMGNIGLFIAQKKIFGKYFKFDDFGIETEKVIDVILNGILKK